MVATRALLEKEITLRKKRDLDAPMGTKKLEETAGEKAAKALIRRAEVRMQKPNSCASSQYMYLFTGLLA